MVTKNYLINDSSLRLFTSKFYKIDEANVICQIGRPEFDGVCEAIHIGLDFPHPDSLKILNLVNF